MFFFCYNTVSFLQWQWCIVDTVNSRHESDSQLVFDWSIVSAATNTALFWDSNRVD